MPTLAMTDAAIQRTISATLKAAKFEPGQVDYFDTSRHRQPGLALRLSCSIAEGGSHKAEASFVLLYRLKGNPKLRRYTIGRYGGYTLAQAREEAGDIVRAARRGEDLVAQRRAQQDATEREAAARERGGIERVAKDFLADWRTKPKRKGGKRASAYTDKLESYFDNHILPRWKGRNLADIKRADVDTLVNEVARKVGEVTGNRVLTAIKTLCNWAVRHELIETNPATLVEKPGSETARERVLSTEELPAVWAAVDALPYPFGPFYKLLLLTGQRLNEVAGMQWSELDLEAEQPLWTLPAARTKGRRPHVVPLSPEALAVIEELKGYRRKEVSLLFTTNGRTPISGFSRAKTLIDKKITEARKEKKQQPLPRWTPHDLRRTLATGVSRLGVPRFIVSKLLNHSDGTVTAIYDRSEYLQEKANALKQWSSYLLRVVSGQPANVTSLAGRRRAETAPAA